MQKYSKIKNRLTCDHTTEEVLTTTITNLYFKHIVELDQMEDGDPWRHGMFTEGNTKDH